MRFLAINSGRNMEPAEAGTLGAAVAAAGGEVWWRVRRDGDAIPAGAAGFDALLLFGGEMGVYEPAYAGHFAALDDLVRAFHAAEKPVLGVCLGAQIIARAFGAEVRPVGFFEYGYTPLARTPAAAEDPVMRATAETPVLFEMHGDTFDLPAGAVPLLAGAAVANQGFRLGAATYGFQCHFEVTAEIIRLWTRRAGIAVPDLLARLPGDPLARLEDDIARHQAGQEAFSATVMAAWLDIVRARTAGEAS